MKHKILSFFSQVKQTCTSVLSSVKQTCTSFLSSVKQTCTSVVSSLMSSFSKPVFRLAMVVALVFLVCPDIVAQNTAGNYEAGTTALGTVTTEIAKYVPVMVKLCYAIAGVVAIVGAISVYIAMNNEEQDVKKKIMMIVGACIFLIAAAQALPLFFGLS